MKIVQLEIYIRTLILERKLQKNRIKDMSRDDLSYVETQYVLDKLQELKGVDKE